MVVVRSICKNKLKIPIFRIEVKSTWSYAVGCTCVTIVYTIF